MQIIQSRRHFLAGAAAAGAAGLIGTTTRGVGRGAAGNDQACAFRYSPTSRTARRLCTFRRTLLRAEGFTDISFVSSGTGPDSSDWIAHDEVDFDWNYPPAHVRLIAKGVPIKVLAGMHVGCLELIANDRVQSDARPQGQAGGHRLRLTATSYLLLMMMAAYVGLDPAKDIEWVTDADPLQMPSRTARSMHFSARRPSRKWRASARSAM